MEVHLAIDHYSLAFDGDTRRAAAVAAFIGDGLAAGDKVLYFPDTGHARAVRVIAALAADPGPYLASGQLVIPPPENAYLGDGPFDMDRMLGAVDQEISEAERHGYPRFRLVGEMSWAPRNQLPLERLFDYEEKLDDLLAPRAAGALCLYDRHWFGQEQVLAAEHIHPSTLGDTMVYNDGMLSIAQTQLPPGLRLAGEIDLSNVAALEEALWAAVGLDQAGLRAAAGQGQADLRLDMSALEFIDVPTAHLLVKAATALGRNHRVILDTPSSVVKKTLALSSGQPDNLVILEGHA